MDQLTQDRVHERWYKLMPKLVKGDRKRYDNGQQCLHCRHYVSLERPLGADWGACTCPLSRHDGKVVFEHHTCPEWSEPR